MVRAKNTNNIGETSLRNVVTAPEREAPKDMFRIGRRSAVSTSELGLYSDHSDNYSRSIYGAAVRKFIIGIMVVVSVILIGIFLYDFASTASINSKVNQETKHIYILQNSLKKANNGTLRKSGVTLAPTIYIVNSSHASILEDRLDDDHNLVYKDIESLRSRSENLTVDDLKPRSPNLLSIKIPNGKLDRLQYRNEASRNQQDQGTIDNHAMMYRVRSKLPYSEEDKAKSNNDYNQRATPFQFEMKGSPPASLKRQKYPQLTQYRYPHTSRNIQDIIKYLTSESNTLNRGVKFTGHYVGSKKYDIDSGHANDYGESTMRDGATNDQRSLTYMSDPLYKYKPKYPSDVNLLATSNLRFSPMDTYTYKPYYDPNHHRLTSNKQPIYHETQYDNSGLYTVNSYVKKQKPKPFSVMLDIYPITDTMEQTKNSASNGKYSELHGTHSQSSYPISMQNEQHRVPADEEKHQMILHLNLYPKKKIKATRNSAIERSERFPRDGGKRPFEKIMIPLDMITKRLTDNVAIENAKLYENKDIIEPLELRYEETLLQEAQSITEMQKPKSNIIIGASTIRGCRSDCNVSNTTALLVKNSVNEISNLTNENSPTFRNINTVDGLQRFANSLIAID
ncbi:PREDICTED: uncharacterized protein LOC105368573 isoform X2 [Ceratosolen solmsi marchali]|uniref:Uncharacterized protein LOC105368573 isoform X2 n=1 Tax=Ceratosolen solmsi marchali TaxID=326594 RepID=A0AAJ6YWU6_9HYME|nr:PREDICTED: uncharacterized protein LOC105368573 isoform X2 [Ceratosolen solmsi marchali]